MRIERFDDNCWLQGGPMPGMRPTMGGPGIQQQQPKGGGTMGIIMPIYTIAIIIFFVYTTMKVRMKDVNVQYYCDFLSER